MQTSKYATEVRRAALPEVLFPEDLALVLGVTEQDARDAAERGLLGPQLYVRGRVAILRVDLLASLGQRARQPSAADRELLP